MPLKCNFFSEFGSLKISLSANGTLSAIEAGVRSLDRMLNRLLIVSRLEMRRGNANDMRTYSKRQQEHMWCFIHVGDCTTGSGLTGQYRAAPWAVLCHGSWSRLIGNTNSHAFSNCKVVFFFEFHIKSSRLSFHLAVKSLFTITYFESWLKVACRGGFKYIFPWAVLFIFPTIKHNSHLASFNRAMENPNFVWGGGQ